MKNLIRKTIQNINVHINTHLEYGLPEVLLAPNELAVVCVVKNGEYFMEQFIAHYQKLGCKHIFFIDNKSSDNTIKIARKYDNISIYSTPLNMGKYEVPVRRVMSTRLIKGGWCLGVDIDEFFDYPYSDIIRLPNFLKYLNDNKYTAVLSHMLDMFSEKSFSELQNQTYEKLKETYQLYDLSRLRKESYSKSTFAQKYGENNLFSHEQTQIYWGGIRKKMCDHEPLLSKIPLFSRQCKINSYTHIHFSDHVYIADISCVLLHYKLNKNIISSSELNARIFNSKSTGYIKFIDSIKEHFYISLKDNNSNQYHSVNELIDNNFIFISNKYLEYVRK